MSQSMNITISQAWETEICNTHWNSNNTPDSDGSRCSWFSLLNRYRTQRFEFIWLHAIPKIRVFAHLSLIAIKSLDSPWLHQSQGHHPCHLRPLLPAGTDCHGFMIQGHKLNVPYHDVESKSSVLHYLRCLPLVLQAPVLLEGHLHPDTEDKHKSHDSSPAATSCFLKRKQMNHACDANPKH